MLSLKFLMVLFLEVSAFILRSLLFSPFSAFLLALGRRCGHTSCPLCLLYLASFSSSWFVCFELGLTFGKEGGEEVGEKTSKEISRW
ncbi:hypothetical protein QOT17_015294 [Balamuthia mandrillaris]